MKQKQFIKIVIIIKTNVNFAENLWNQKYYIGTKEFRYSIV